MKRRHFVFGSLKAAALLTPVLSLRRAEAADPPPMRAVLWISSCGYPDADAFFPSGGELDFVLSPILADFEPLRDDMVIVNGIDLRDSGLNPKGNNHVRCMGKVATAKDVLPAADDQDGNAGGISIDQLIAAELGLPVIELQINHNHSAHMRHRPFALGPNAFKPPLVNPVDAWNKLFSDFEPSNDPETIALHKQRLAMKKSMLDDMTSELARFRSELSGIEKLKLDIHEDAIRRAEESVARDLEAEPVVCEVPAVPDSSTNIVVRSEAQFDVAFAALSCGRADIVSMLIGSSGYHWKYEWAGVTGVVDSGHDEVHHNAGGRRDDYVTMARWDWNELRKFVERLKNTPDGEGNMLDSTSVLALSHFGRHHQLSRIPVVFFGNARGQLQTGRYIDLPTTQHNDKVLTSFAHLVGAPISGIGDDPECGPLLELA